MKKILGLSVLILVIAVIQTGLWNSHGGLIDFIRGQLDAKPDLAGLSPARTAAPPIPALVTVNTAWPVHTVAPEYVSFAIDSSQVVGGKWWNPEADTVEMGSGSRPAPVFNFDRPLLDRLTRELAPAYLRIGGSEADKIYYDMSGTTTSEPPEGYHSVMTRDQWDGVNRFARRNGLKLAFTLNTGPSSRGKGGAWDPENAESLIRYSADQGYAVHLWEMGNELNLYWYIYSPSDQVSTAQYHRDLAAGRKLVKRYFPDAMFAGQGSAFWPLLGEPLGFFFSFMPDYMERSGDLTDLVSWHYYPQQSRRGLIASRRARPARLLDPVHLDEAAFWGRKIQGLRDRFAPGRPVWLGETGNAQFGGEPGLSDRFLAGLWWLDQLGLLARTGHDVVVRQTLSGMNYGMIEPDTLAINPDYWNTLLWKRLMGQTVFQVDVNGTDRLRAYAHGHPATAGAVTLLLINLDHRQPVRPRFPGLGNAPLTLFHLNTEDLFSKTVYLNGTPLRIRDGHLPRISGNSTDEDLIIPPLSCAFAVIPDALASK